MEPAPVPQSIPVPAPDHRLAVGYGPLSAAAGSVSEFRELKNQTAHMREIDKDDILRFTRAVHVPRKGPWEVALLCPVREGETVGFGGMAYRAGNVSRGEFCAAPVYQATLVMMIVPPLGAAPPADAAAGFSGAAAGRREL